MSVNKKILSFILILCLTAGVVLTGCGSEKQEETADDYDFSVFFGSMDDAIELDTMLIEYEKTTGVKINPIIISDSEDSTNTLKSLLNDEDPPAVYAANSEVDGSWLATGGFVADFSGINSGVEGNNFPYVMEGYGLAYDRSMFDDIFGKDLSDKLIKDLRRADFNSWTAFVKAADRFIKGRSNTEFSVGGNTYAFPAGDKVVPKDLNGVFAIPGADSNIYGYDVMDMVTQTADLTAWEASKDSTESALQTLNPSLTTYISGLDLMTSYLSGEYSSGIRGVNFVNEEYYTGEQTEAMFMNGKAMFSIIDSSKYSTLEELNAEKALTLEYLPIKMPYAVSIGGKTSSGAVLNSSIPAEVASSLYINEKCSKEVKKEALDFLLWFMSKENEWIDPLSASIKTYVDEGNTMIYEFVPEELEGWEKEIFGEKGGVRTFLKKELWTDEYIYEMKVYLADLWCDN